MKVYIIRRLIQAIGVCLAISAISFFLLFLNADPALVLLPPEAEVEDIILFKKQMGLDRPVIIQYFDFLRKVLLHGDFGRSFLYRIPALDLIQEHVMPTVKLSVAALLIAVVVSVPVGVLAAVRRYSAIDNLASFGALIGQAIPVFWLGIMLIIVFGVWLQWLPISGNATWAHIILPAVTLSSYLMPLNMRLVRSSMLDVLQQDYVRTARAKGVTEHWVILKHAFRNAAIPLVTILGLQFGALLGGAVIVETIFAWPGLGRLAVDSIYTGDYPVVQAIVVIFATFVVLANLAADIAAAVIDPRIRLN